MVPAFDAVGAMSFVNVTLLVVLHVPFTIVQLNVAVLPEGTAVTVDVAECMLVIVAVPLTTAQVPVPTDAAFPARVKLPLLHCA